MAEVLHPLFQNQRAQVSNFIKDNIAPLNNKLVIVTGANSGLGFHICQIALYKGARILMACRNIDRANKAKEKLLNQFPNSQIDIVIYDQSSISSCRELAKEIIEKYSNFSALVLNAGVYCPKKKMESKDGFPLTSGINVFGVIAILEGLQPLLSNAQEEKRIIFQSSLAAFIYKFKSIDKSLLNKNNSLFKQYCLSKAALTNCFLSYSKNVNNENVKYLLAEPGICETDIIRNYPRFIAFLAHHLFYKWFCHSSLSGSLSSSCLMSIDCNNGDYYRPGKGKGIKGLPNKNIIKEKYIKKDLANEVIKLVRNK